jgi:hypothetical protein
MRSKSTLRQFIRESSNMITGNSVLEHGSKEHISELDRIIEDLITLKHTLRKGEHRKFHRKEAHRIQDAICAIRYLKKKAQREGIRKGILHDPDRK